MRATIFNYWNLKTLSQRSASLLALLILALLPIAWAAQDEARASGIGTAQTLMAATPIVVEFYNPDLDNYFITADPGEQTFVDGGTVGRWQRTGNTFPSSGSGTVCRFYGGPLGPNSHFYTSDLGECNYLKSIFNPAQKSWKFESNDFATTPAVGGACPANLFPVYRAYNNGDIRGVDSNHRITSNRAAILEVVKKGWKDEGVVMCVAAGSAFAVSPVAGVWDGTTAGGEAARAIILEDGTYYLLLNSVAASPKGRVIQGTSQVSDGTLTSADAVSFPVNNLANSGLSATPAKISGTYTPRGTLTLKISSDRGDDIVTATYVPGSSQAPTAGAPTGSYLGNMGHATESFSATFSIMATGSITGAGTGGCAFSAITAPHTAANAYDLIITPLRGSCTAIGPNFGGLFYYDEQARRAYGLATFGERSEMFFFVGNKQ